MQKRWQLQGAVAATIVMAMSVNACSDYRLVEPPKDRDAVYWELKADHRAVLLSMLSPYDTLQLTATPWNVNGDELSLDTLHESARVIWESADTSAVRVSQTGVLTAKKIATRVNVYATLSVGDITRRDTIWVGVTSTTPSSLDSLVLYVPTGANTVPASGTLELAVRARLVNGQLLTGVPVSYRASHRWLADFKGSNGLLYGLIPDDSVYAYATTTVYGVTRRDSLFLYTGLPLRAIAQVFVLEAKVSNNRDLIYVPKMIDPPSGPGSSFRWWNNSITPPSNAIGFPPGGMKVDIIFDRPELAEAFLPFAPPPYNQTGNILQLPYDLTAGSIVAYRKFTQPGEHWYTVQPLGVRGKITIGTR
jgi:hypothetical protein